MIAWLTAHWGTIALVLGVLISLLNAATTHWSEHTGLVKWLLYIADALSIIRSKGTSGSVLGNAKLPLVPTGSTGIVDGKHLAWLLLPALLLSGCCSTARCYLARGLVAVQACDKIAVPAIEKSCESAVDACPKGTAPEKCPGYVDCAKRFSAYKASMDVIGRELGAANKALHDVGVK